MTNDLIDSDHSTELNRLDSKSNDDFDKTYVADQVRGHEDAVAMLEDYAKNGDDAKLKDFARQILPTVREHLARAKALRAQIGA